jgi:glycerol-3-phosphate acyltransferase PlsX
MGIVRLAVDAMGGDFAPEEIVVGAILGARQLGLDLLLVGDPTAIQEELEHADAEDLSLEIIPANSVIAMEENPAQAVRSRPGASINVACQLVLEDRADGVLTMGHTGAGMIAALFRFGRIPQVERPAAIVPLLGLRQDLYLIDAGANTEVRPNHLLQFAQMGSAYLRSAYGIPEPRVGLLSNGSEPNKGNAVGREAYALLVNAGDLNFVGNVEGHSLLTGELNLIVADGFVGNVLLKAAEGITFTILDQVEQILPQLSGKAAALLGSHLINLRSRNDYAQIGVSTLLGVQRPMFIGHGRSKSYAVVNGMATAQRVIVSDAISKIRRALMGIQSNPG